MATQVASLYGVLTLDDSGFSSGILAAEKSADGFGGQLQGMADSIATTGAKLSVLGGAINSLVSPLVDFGKQAVGAYTDFDESMKNIQAAAGYTNDEMKGLSESVRAIGAASRYGPGEAAKAFYDVAGGVTDASSRMAVFTQAIKTAEAGNADLQATTSALISVTNAYGLKAREVAGASDVLTRIVGTGVGTMNDFAAALPKVTTMAANLGVPLKDVGAQMAYLTTKGFTASESATQLSAMMTTLLSPTKEVAEAIKKAGFESGEAMIKAKGLSGAYAILKEDNGGSLNGLITNVEALRGGTVLATDAFVKFNAVFGNFSTTLTTSSAASSSGFMAGFSGDKITSITTGLQGATDAAQATQMSSAAAQFDLLNASVENLRITVGEQLTPVLLKITNEVLGPLVQGVMAWVNANPQAVAGIAMLVGAGAALAAVLTVAGTAITAVGVGLGVLLSPIGLAIAAVVLLGAAYLTNFGGIKDFIDKSVAPIMRDFIKTLQDIWTAVGPGLRDLAAWFVGGAMQNVISIFNTAKNIVGGLINVLRGIWDIVGPGVQAFANGIKTTLGPVVTFIQGIAASVQDLISKLGGVVDTVTGNTGGDSFGKSGGTSLGDLKSQMGKAAGGPVMGGVPVTVGEQGREIFVPSSSGTIIPNNQLGEMGGISVSIGAIYANDAAGGRAAAESFDGRLRELQASRGGR